MQNDSIILFYEFFFKETLLLLFLAIEFVNIRVTVHGAKNLKCRNKRWLKAHRGISN